MRHELRLHHPTRFVLATSPCPENSVYLVEEDDGWLEFAREAEDGGDEFVAIAVPFFRQGGDVEVDEAGAAFFC